jgi:hypothetical protein
LLEDKVAKLEATLSLYQNHAAGPNAENTSELSTFGGVASGSLNDIGDATASFDIAAHFQGLQLREDGSTTVHGPGSFFKLSRDDETDATHQIEHSTMSDGQVKLTTSAWIERSQEENSRLPVWTFHSVRCSLKSV